MIKSQLFMSLILKYQPSGAAGGTPSLPVTPHHLQNPKWLPVGPKMADGVWKGVYPKVFGHSKQLSLNKFFDPSTPSMRKVDDGEKKEEKRIMMIIVATNVIATRPPGRQLLMPIKLKECQLYHFSTRLLPIY